MEFDGASTVGPPASRPPKRPPIRHIFDTLFSFSSKAQKMTATSGPGSSHVRSSSDFEPQKCQFRGPFLSDFKTCQKRENQAETAARTLFSTFGKVQNQVQNQVRNQEP